ARRRARPSGRRLRRSPRCAVPRSYAEAHGMIAALLVVLAAPVGEATPFALELRVEPEEVTLGEHVSVRIAVEHDARDVYSLEAVDPAPLAVPPGTPPPHSRREQPASGEARPV